MPALDNPRHERFAQELAKGKSADEAYQEAGYKANDGNCIRLKGNERVAARIAELQERAAMRTEVTIAGLTRELLEAVSAAKANPNEAAMINAWRQSVMDIAKLNGLVTDKTENVNRNATISEQPMSEDKWQEQVNQTVQ